MLRVVLSFILCAISSLAAAQTGGPPLFYADKLDSGRVDRMTNAIRDTMGRLICDNQGRRCAPDTPEERARPIIPRDVELRVIDAGLMSAMAEWCGIGSNPHFLAMMGYERGGRRWTERQLSYIAALHGIAKQSLLANDTKSGRCTEKAGIEALIQDRIRQYGAASPSEAANNVTTGATPRDPAPNGPPISSMLKLFPSAQINQMIATVRDNIHRLTLPDGSAIARETEAERAQPLLPPEIERRAVDAGMVSGVSDWCGVDSHMHYTAMMAWERAQRRWSEKQLAYIGGLHAAARSAIMGSRQHHVCDPNGRAGITNSLMTRVQQYRTATP